MSTVRETGGVPAGFLLLLGLGVLLTPGATGSLVVSAPLGGLGRVLLVLLVTALVGTAIFRAPRARWSVAAVVMGCLVTRASLGLADQPEGWALQVVPETPADARVAFFWRYGAHPYRIVSAIDSEGSRFGLHFFNDTHYNAPGLPDGPRETGLAWRATWSGHVHALGGNALEATLSGAGAVRVRVDGQVVFEGVDPQETVLQLPLRGDAARLVVEYAKPAGVHGRLRWSWARSTAVVVLPYAGESPDRAPQALRGLLDALATLTAVFLAIGSVARSVARAPVPRWRSHPAAAGLVVLGFLLVSGVGLWAAQRHAGTVYYMSVGNDPITYEGNARDIMANGPLMLNGKPPGQADAYFHYPLYPYVVALAHWVVGEDAAGVMVANALLVACVLPLLWTLGWWNLPTWAAGLGVVVATAFLGRDALPYALEVFTDNLFFPLVLLALNVGTRAMRRDSAPLWLLTGWLIALGAATRPSLLTYLPFLGLGILLANGWSGLLRSMRAGVLLGTGFALGVLPFTLRNYVASGQIVMLVNSWVGVAVFLVPPGESYADLYQGRPVGLRASLALAVEVFMRHPWRSLILELRKLFFSFGFTGLGPAGTSHPEFIAFFLGALVALWRRAVDRPLLVVTGAFAASHVAAMVMAAPWTYGDKSILPLQVVFLFWAVMATGARSAETMR